MNDPCRLELRGLSGSEPCGACNHPARDHRGHREYVEPEYWTVEYMIGNSDWISHGLGVYTTRDDAEKALKSCSISDDRIRLARCDSSSRIIGAVVEASEPEPVAEARGYTVQCGALGLYNDASWFTSLHGRPNSTLAEAEADLRKALTEEGRGNRYRIVAPDGTVVDEAERADCAPDRPTVTMSQEAYDAAIAGAKREGWSRAAIKLRDGHRFVSASDYLARTNPDAWPTPPNPLTKIASALGCDADEAACLDSIDSLRRELECAEDASSMERQRRKDAESTRDAAVDLASNRGEQVSRLTAELAKALEAAPARGFPEALRERIAEWCEWFRDLRRSGDAPVESQILVQEIQAWLTSQPVDETEALRARVRELEAERDSALADMTLAREDLAGCEYDLAKLIRAVYDGRGIEDAANDAEMNGREGWLDVALDLAAPGPARCMRSERDSARAKAIEECALEVLATPSKGVVYTPDSLSSRAFVDKADVVEAIRALADRGAK